MKKTYLLMAAIFLTSWIFTFSSCSNSFLTEETVTFILPFWPPQSEFNIKYPELEKWQIQIYGPDISKEFDSNAPQITINLPKNIPCSITATPVTKVATTTSNTSFFYPAGTIYPFYLEDTKQILTWEGGYSASLMESIYKSQSETGVTTEHLESFQKSFNWKKLQDSIQKKIDTDSEKFYNPWQNDTQTLLENLCYAAFSANYITPKNVIIISLENAKISNKELLLSPYIPENINIQQKEVLTLQKNQSALFMYNQIYAAEITCSSSKKVSVAYTYLPILY